MRHKNKFSNPSHEGPFSMSFNLRSNAVSPERHSLNSSQIPPPPPHHTLTWHGVPSLPGLIEIWDYSWIWMIVSSFLSLSCGLHGDCSVHASVPIPGSIKPNTALGIWRIVFVSNCRWQEERTKKKIKWKERSRRGAWWTLLIYIPNLGIGLGPALVRPTQLIGAGKDEANVR